MTNAPPDDRELRESDHGTSILSDALVPGPLVRRMLLIVLIAVALAGILAAWIVSRASAHEVRDRLLRHQTDEVELVARLLASKIEQSQKVLGTVASGITPDMLKSPSLLEWMMQQGLPALRFFDGVEIARTDGQLVLNMQGGKVEPGSGVDPDERDILLRTVVQGKPLVSGVIGETASDARIMFTLPLVSEDAQVMGAVGGLLRLQSQGLLPHSLTLPARDDSRLIVFTSDGVILSHPQLPRVTGDVRSEPGLGPVFERWQSEHKPINTGRGDTINESDYLVSMAGVPLPQWWVARVTESGALLTPLVGAQRRSWWAAAAAVGIVTVMALAMLVWVASPLTRLHRRAQGILMSDPVTADAHPASAESELLTDALDHLEAQKQHHGHQAEFSRLQLQGILEQAPTGIVITRNETLELISQQASLLLGYARPELEGQSVRMLLAGESQADDIAQEMQDGTTKRGVYEGEIALRRKDGSLLWARVVGRMAWDRRSALVAVWVLEDITSARNERQKPGWGTSHDVLTGLPNRATFLERVRALVRKRSEQHAQGDVDAAEEQGTALLHVDLDHFTLVNDRLGHETGDMQLRQFANLLDELIRPVGWVARLGGDEFAVVLPNCSAARAEMIAEHVRASVEEWEFVFDGEATQTTVSIGIVAAPPDLDDVTPWLRAADMACYYAKRAGRNQVMLREIADKAMSA